MGLQSSIFSRKDHAHALSVVDIIVETGDFPTTVRCPNCGEVALNIYEDVIKTDLWLTCTNCPAHGNIITFASAYWKIDTLATIAKFKELGVNTRELNDIAVNAAVRYAKTDTAAEWFWQQAMDQLWTHGNDLLSVKFRDFGLSPELPCRGLAGVAWPEQVAELCRSINPAYPRKLRNKVPILVFPYCDLPRHYCGFLLIQYLEEFETRRIFLPMEIQRAIVAWDAGYYFLEQAVLAKNSTVNNAVFVIEDPQWVLKTQTIQLRHGDEFLPICASYCGKEASSVGNNWPNISHRRKFFYNTRVIPELVSQAANARGYICALRADGLPKPTQPAKTIKTLGQLYRSAVTWQKTLTHVFENTSDVAAHSFAINLTIPAEKLRSFFVNNPVVTAEKAEQILSRVAPVYFSSSESTQYSTNVFVKDGGWYTGKNSFITNCMPVIEKVLHTDADKYYIGHIKKQNTVVQFQERARQIEKIGLLAYAERLLAAQGAHVLFASPWNRRSHITAMTLRTPEIIHIRSQPGWDETTKEFYCADYAINLDGVIRNLPHPELNTSKFRLPEPGTFAPPSLRKFFTPAAENAAVWTVMAAALSNALAPVLDKPQQSVGITSDLFLSAREILKAIHVEHKNVNAVSNKLSKLFAERVRNTIWPKLILSRANNDRFIELSLVKYPNTAAFVRVLPGTTVAALGYGWQIINAPGITPGIDYSALPYVFAGYAQHAIKTRNKFFGSAVKNLTMTVLNDLHGWLRDTYNDSFNLTQAEKYLNLPGDEIIHLMREINNAILAGEIDILPSPRKQKQEKNYIVRNNETWWLNRAAIDTYFKKICGVTPNWMAMAERLSELGLLRGEKIIHRTTGLLVDSDWCDKFWTNYKDTKKKNIG